MGRRSSCAHAVSKCVPHTIWGTASIPLLLWGGRVGKELLHPRAPSCYLCGGCHYVPPGEDASKAVTFICYLCGCVCVRACVGVVWMQNIWCTQALAWLHACMHLCVRLFPCLSEENVYSLVFPVKSTGSCFSAQVLWHVSWMVCFVIISHVPCIYHTKLYQLVD